MQIQGKYRCINCFNELNNENDICSCGYDSSQYKSATHRLSPGTVLYNNYYIGRVIGEGGFGITYVGYDANLDMRLAIKEFFLSGVNTRNTTYSDEIEASAEEKKDLFETYREKFINEARLLAKFNNEDGIVTVHNFFKANSTAYIIMEFLDGQTLKEYLKTKGKLSVNEVVDIFLPIMRTLDKVHTLKLVHRDISPDNIIFTKNNKVKLLDFGAAREVSDDGNKSLSVVLKYGFAPPEQYQSHGNQGPWTDVYAMSATIYKCLTGKTPIEAIDRTLGEELEPISVIAPECPQNVSDVIMKGLAVKISDRYQSMGEMAEDLKKAYMSADVEPVATVKEDSEATVVINDDNDIPKDGSERKEEISKIPVVDIPSNADGQYPNLKSAKVGEIVEFGNYNGFTTWRVLSKDGANLMLITENVVDKRAFNEENVTCDWSSCSLRAWLNDEYYNKAFSEKEKALIKESDIEGEKDKIFLLSSDETKRLFKDDNDRIAHNSEYEAKWNIESPYGYWWWLRTPVNGNGTYCSGSRVDLGGSIGDGYDSVNVINNGVRPALNINLSDL